MIRITVHQRDSTQVQQTKGAYMRTQDTKNQKLSFLLALMGHKIEPICTVDCFGDLLMHAMYDVNMSKDSSR